VVGEPTVEKCSTLDLLIEPPLIHTFPGYNGSSMTATPQDWAHLKSTLGLHVELPANPNSPAGNPIVLLHGDPLPAQGNMHPLACIDEKPLPPLGVLTTLKSLMCYHYGNLHSSPFSFPVPNEMLPQCSLVNSHVSMEDFEEEITFYFSDGNREDDDEDVLMEIEPCTPFGIQLFPHHDDVFPQAPCEVVPTSREIACHNDFSDGEPSPVITGEPTIWEPMIGEPTIGEPTAGELTTGKLTAEEPSAHDPDPKSTTGFASLSSGVCTSNEENTIWKNLAVFSPYDGVLSQPSLHLFYKLLAQDVYVQVPPDPPHTPPLPSDSMAIVRDKTKTLGSNCTWSQVLQINLVKVDGYTKVANNAPIKVDSHAQAFHLLKIFCVTMSIALSFAVYGMLTPLPFDRGKMVSSQSPPHPHAASLPISPRPYQASLLHPSLPLSGVLEEGYSSHVNPYCLWGEVNKIMGSSDMHKLYCAQALAYHSEHLYPDHAWIWITQESHIQIPTSSSHHIWKNRCF